MKAIHYTHIPSQLHLKHSLPRLKREGKRHWYSGKVLEHPRQDLQAVFDAYLTEALTAGYCVDNYRVKELTRA